MLTHNKQHTIQGSENSREEIAILIRLAEAYREHGYYGEAYETLLNAKLCAERRLGLSSFDPQGIIIVIHMKKTDEGEEYLDSARERADELVKCIAPVNIDLKSDVSLIYESKLLLAEILLQKATMLTQQNRDALAASKLLSTFLVPSITLQFLANHTSGSKPQVLNSYMFQLSLIETASCLTDMKQYHLATKCLTSVTKFANDSLEDTFSKNVNSLMERIEQAQLKLVENDKILPKKQSFKKEESDDEFDEGWPDSDDESEKPFSFKSANANSKADSDGDDDDWPSSEDEDDSRPAPFAGLIDNSDDEDEESVADMAREELFPTRYRFFKSREFGPAEEPVNSEPSTLLTLKTDDNSQSFKDGKEMRKWLDTIVSKHIPPRDEGVEEDVGSESKQFNEVAVVEAFQTNLKYIDTFSKKWAKEYNTTCWTLYYMATRESRAQCWKLLVDYFNQLPNAKITKNVDQSDVQKLIKIFNVSLQLLHIAALLWTPDYMNAFKNMMDSINQFYPRQSDAITLVEMKAMCHHIKSLALSPKRQESSRIVPTLIQIFEKHNKKASVIPTPASSIIGNSKTHLKKLASSVELACEALLIFHHYMCNMSPITLELLLSDEDNISITICDEELQSHELFQLWNRFAYLESLYCKLNYYSILKALTILSLGQCCRHFSEHEKAEMALFEALFIIDRVAPYSEAIPSIKCDFGTKALVEYATSLITNNKYPYAALAYLAGVKNHKSIHQEYDYVLISELAELSSRHDDWKRSCYYLRKLLKYNMKQGGEINIPKVVYLSEKLCEENMERGDFRNAEYYITTSVLFVKNSGRDKMSSANTNLNSDFSTRTGETELNLQLKLANLFLQGYYFERGIDLLARIIEEKLTPMQRCLVLTNLAEAYLKKRWLKECEFVLNKLGPLLESQIFNTGDSTNEVKILEIAARCYFRNSKYALALFCVNAALQRCSIPARLAKLFFLKGKIFQQICHPKTPTSFPLSLVVDKSVLDREENYSLFQQFYKEDDLPMSHYGATLRRNSLLFTQREVYKDASQVLQDCIYCFTKAIYYYTAVSDEISIAKVNLEISKVQMEYIFSDVSFLQGDPITCSRLPASANSEAKLESHKFSHDFIVLRSIEEEFLCAALDTSVRTTHIMLSLDSYISMAECRYMQGRLLAAQSFWNECRDVMFTLFMDESEVVVAKGAPPGFLEKLLAILTRLVRLLFCFEPAIINKNLSVIDALLLLEIEMEQVLKRSGESSTEATFSHSDSGNESPSDSEGVDETSLIAQNKIYQALPCNSSINRGKSLPFLRKSSKKRSVKLAGFRTRKPAIGGSLKGSQSSGSSRMDGYLDAVYMTERVTERVWSCFYRMKQHSRKYSGQTMSERELCFKNQQSMRRLYNLMLAIRGKKLTSLSPSNSNSIPNSTGDRRSSRSRRMSERSEHTSAPTTPLEEGIVDQIDKKIGHMSLTSGDLMLVNCFLRTLGTEEDRKKFQSLSTSPVDTEDNLASLKHARQDSLPADVYMIQSNSSITNQKLLSRLIYILSLHQIVIYYVPSTGKKDFHQLGGRKNGKSVASERTLKSMSDSSIVSGTAMLKMSGTIITETSKTFSGTKKSSTDTGSSSIKDQATKYLFDQLDQYINALLLQGRKEKRQTGLEQTEALLDLLQTGLFTKLPVDYSPKPQASQSSNSKKIDYKTLFGKKKFKFARIGTKNISSVMPKLDELLISDQPLLLLCSQPLQIIPWELMFSEFMTRTFSLQNVSRQKHLRDRHVPAYFSFYSEDESKYIAPIEKKRKDWLYLYLRQKLGLGLTDHGIFHDSLPNLPLHCPLIRYGKKPSKSKKFKDVNFVKLSMISDNPTQIITHIESFLNTPQYPVFLFTLSDLIDLSEAVLCILSYRPDCTLIFIAEGMMSQAAELLLEMQNMYSKSGQLSNIKSPMTTYKFFAYCMSILHKELRIPTVIINPPLP